MPLTRLITAIKLDLFEVLLKVLLKVVFKVVLKVLLKVAQFLPARNTRQSERIRNLIVMLTLVELAHVAAVFFCLVQSLIRLGI